MKAEKCGAVENHGEQRARNGIKGRIEFSSLTAPESFKDHDIRQETKPGIQP